MTEDRTQQGQTRPAPTARLAAWLLLIGVVGLVTLVDQLTKAYVAKHLARGESWVPLDFVEPVFRITLVHNTGAAFGMFPQGSGVFLTIAVIVSAIIIFYYRQITTHALLLRVALGLQMGGALSNNLIDRIRLGYVIDFLNVEPWPVFNVADSCIVVGVLLLAFEMWRSERQEIRRSQLADSAGSQPDTPPDVSQKEVARG